jgi:hypothetical protein
VALGAFADLTFPKPTLSIWEQTRHAWVGVAHEVRQFPQGGTDPTALR